MLKRFIQVLTIGAAIAALPAIAWAAAAPPSAADCCCPLCGCSK